MTGEGQLDLGGEDAHAAEMPRVLRRQHEGRFGEVELARERLHRALAEPAGVGEHGELVSTERLLGENVADHEFHGLPMKSRLPISTPLWRRISYAVFCLKKKNKSSKHDRNCTPIDFTTGSLTLE